MLFFITWKGIIVLFALFAPFLLPLKYTSVTFFEFRQILPYIVWIWGNFDGTHYVSIAKSGYFNMEHPFFPLYPLLIYLLTSGKTYYLPSALFISHVSFFLSFILLYKLLLLDKKRELIPLTFSLLVLFPTSFFYGAAYNDALFFLLACLTIYVARKHSFVLASIFGGLATLARLNGLALFFFILFEYIFFVKQKVWCGISWENLRESLKSLLSVKAILQTKIYFIFIIPFSFLSYLLYTHLLYRSWQLVFSSMTVWNQEKVTFPLQIVYRYVKIFLFYRPLDLVFFVAFIEFLFVLLYVFLLVFSYKRIRFSYWIFFFLSILIPSLTGTFQGMPRYGLHVYPFFLSLSLFLYNKNIAIKALYFCISIVLLMIFIALFTHGYFIS